MSSTKNLGDVFMGGATTSQHVDAEDDQHFEDTTFRLKRTRSLGVLDEFIPDKDKDDEPKVSDSLKDRQNPEQTDDKDDTSALDDTNDEPGTITSPDMLPFDDTDISLEPSRHVDYLSHKWDMSDISKSWRYVIRKRPYVPNAARLENASWRTWAQRRGNLKTISPEVVNWSKDSDVTWLYGPILKDEENDAPSDEDNHRAATTATSAVAGDISLPSKSKSPKPILKRRTVQDMMISHANLMKLQKATSRMHERQLAGHRAAAAADGAGASETRGNEVPEFDDYDAISAKLNSQYFMPTAATSSFVSVDKYLDLAPSSADPTPDPKERRIHFNNEVQQCIAVDHISSDEYDSDDYDYNEELGEDYVYEDQQHEDDEEEEESDEDDGFVFSVRSPSSGVSIPGLPVPPLSSSEIGGSSSSVSESVSTSQSYRTIHLLPSTTLNLGSSDEESDDENPYTLSQSHNSTSRGYDYYYDYNSVYTVDPNHAIYGRKTPDVIDVPENIAMGSNVDYKTIEDDGALGKPETTAVADSTVNESLSANDSENSRIPLTTDNSVKESPFAGSDSEDDSDSDSDDGLSISTRRSSHSLAQQVFNRTTPHSERDQEQHLYPIAEPTPVRAINPSHSLTSLSKQPPSSGLLSLLFFGSGTAGVDKLLSSLFLGTDKQNTH
ncbi:hypothetical protein QFC19_002023 [Naganishia cerealis]|uniref:Uncharacterized protein n=1 Tax=Naganishia cerealis TaxID=610337 RepID=A0ACC2WCW5_9TREE|nr:hypothetical protein QFC19_002023 [Naganishia cerealis]